MSEENLPIKKKIIIDRDIQALIFDYIVRISYKFKSNIRSITCEEITTMIGENDTFLKFKLDKNNFVLSITFDNKPLFDIDYAYIKGISVVINEYKESLDIIILQDVSIPRVVRVARLCQNPGFNFKNILISSSYLLSKFVEFITLISETYEDATIITRREVEEQPIEEKTREEWPEEVDFDYYY